MNYVIYGAGFRGKHLFNYLEGKKIQAFIDMDEEKHGQKYCNKTIISLDEYMNEYKKCFIIITPIYSSDEIEKMLKENNIYQYYNQKDLPLEFVGYGNIGFEACYKEIKKYNDKKICIYGLNPLSFLLYDLLYQEKEISICPERGCCLEKKEWIRKNYPQIRMKEYTEICEDETIFKSIIGQIKDNFSNKIIDLFEYASSNIMYRNDKLLSIKAIFKNEKRCFIVATGPSLRVEDLHTLTSHGVFCFGVNSIIRIKDEWIPNAYVVTDSIFIRDNLDAIKKYDCKIKFVGDSCQEYWSQDINDSYRMHIAMSGTGVGFSEEIEQKVYSGYAGGGTVTYVCLQLAIYMGFSEIYLLGVDCNYTKGSKNNHFIAEDMADNINHNENLMIKGYIYAKEYADTHNIKIYNATRGGMLEVFERVDFDSVFEDKKG